MEADKADAGPGVLGLLPQHLRDIYNYTYYRTGNHHDAEDLTTQTFIQAYGTSSEPSASRTGGRCGRG